MREKEKIRNYNENSKVPAIVCIHNKQSRLLKCIHMICLNSERQKVNCMR